MPSSFHCGGSHDVGREFSQLRRPLRGPHPLHRRRSDPVDGWPSTPYPSGRQVWQSCSAWRPAVGVWTAHARDSPQGRGSLPNVVRIGNRGPGRNEGGQLVYVRRERRWHRVAPACAGSVRRPRRIDENNIFLDPQSRPHQYSNVLHTPQLGPGRRYTLLALSGLSHYVRFSEDGLRWTDWSSEPVIPRFHDVGFYMYDERENLFRGMVKCHLQIRGRRRRIQNWTVSEDALD